MQKVNRLGNLYSPRYGTNFAGNVWSKNGICPALTTMSGGGREPMIIVSDNDKENLKSLKDTKK